MAEIAEVAGAARRMVRAVGNRAGVGDPSDLEYLTSLRGTIDESLAQAVDGLRRAGYSDTDIGQALGMRRQSVQERWPRAGELAGSGHRWAGR